MEEKPGSLAEQLLENFINLDRLLHQEFFRRMDSKLKPTQMIVMMKLLKTSHKTGKGLRVSEIASFLGVTNSAVTQIITSLEKSGYVLREMDREDRRAVRVELSNRGKQILKPAMAGMEQSFSGLVKELGIEEGSTLNRLLSLTEEYFR